MTTDWMAYTTDIDFLMALEAGSLRSGCQDGSSEGSLPGVWTATFSLCPHLAREWEKKEKEKGDFPGGPVAKTQYYQFRWPRFDPWSGN